MIMIIEGMIRLHNLNIIRDKIKNLPGFQVVQRRKTGSLLSNNREIVLKNFRKSNKMETKLLSMVLKE